METDFLGLKHEGLRGKAPFSEGTPRVKLKIHLYFAKVTFPRLKQEAGWKINSWTQTRRLDGNYERVHDINGKT